MKILVVSTMFPNRAEPVHAVFVHNRVAHVAKHCEVRVLSPIPYFPLAWLLKRYSHRRSIPKRDRIGELDVQYPRFLSIPKVCKPLDGVFLFLSLWWAVRRLRQHFEFDLIEAHLAFADGFACWLLARLLNKPLVVTLRGHDINVVPRHPVRRWQVRCALRGADRVIAVADALRRAAIPLGCHPGKLAVVPNGVDTTLFSPGDRLDARRRLRLPPEGKVVLSVGHLVERKGFHLVIEALHLLRESGIRDVHYVVVGGPGEEGNFLPAIHRQIRRFSLEPHVFLAGPQLNHTLRDWYNAADVFCLASSKEGRANVLLESLACGTPVVATNVWGNPEVITGPEYGLLVERSPESIAAALRTALTKIWDRSVIAQYATTHTWNATATRVIENFDEAFRSRTPSPVDRPERSRV